jgi:alanine racemase
VVKANAYGHGIERVFEGLRGADGFALLDLAEAERVRALGWRGPILLLEGVFEPRDLELCSRLGPVAHRALRRADRHAGHPQDAGAAPRVPQAELGHEPPGLCAPALRTAWTRLNALPQVDEISLMTHFSDADGPRGIAHQMAAFAATRDLPGERSLCNSAATLRHAQAPACAPTGCAPASPLRQRARLPEHSAATGSLQPTMTLSTRLIGTQQLQAGRHRGLRLAASRPTAHAHRRGGLRLCRRLPAPLRPPARRCWWTACAPAWWAA